MKKTIGLLAALGMAFTCSATVVWSGVKLAPEFQAEKVGRLADNVEVIVQYKVVPTEAHHQRVAALGGTLRNRMDHIKGAHYTLPKSALATLANDPDVAYISPNRSLKAMFDQITDGTVHSDYANSIGQTGAGIGVAIIDSGIVDLPDFHTGSTSRIVYQQSFLPTAGLSAAGAALASSGVDQYGHGTHVAGILAGNGNGTVYVGTAPQANIINLRVLDQNGQGTDASVIMAIGEAIALKNKYNIKVINLSLGRPVYESASQDPLCQAVEAAWQAGIAVVVAAGNDGRDNTDGLDGYGTITAPGNDPYVITVGCIKSNGTTTMADDHIASYSSKGPTMFDHYAKPDVVAPGNLIVSTLPAGLTLSNEYPGNRVAGNYFTLSGTSMATPVVAGAAAMAFQAMPSMTNDQVKAAIMASATKSYFPTSSVAVDPVTGISYTSYYDIFTVGAGELNIQAADAMTSLPPAVSAKSPVAVYNATTGQVTLSGVSGANVVWGASSLQGFNVVWGADVVWGASSTDASETDLLTINGEQ